MADFMHVTMDLRHLFANKEEQTGAKEKDKEAAGAEGKEGQEKKDDQQPKVKKIPLKDWGKELKRRIDANAALDPETRSPEGDIRAQFWKDFFNSNWKPEVADKLLQIGLLREDIEEIGFNPLINPFLAFLKRSFAQKLALAGLLNAETFKGLHNAVAHDYLADSEFVKENTYNIIYCLDLYKQPAADIERYLKLQKSILNPSAPAYNEKTMAKNIKVFLVNGFKSMRDKGAKLNELADVETFMKTQLGISVSKDDEEAANSGKASGKTERKDLIKIVQELRSNVQLMAAMQYISMTTNSSIAHKAMRKVSVPNVSGEELAEATAFVAKHVKGIRLDDETVETFVELLLDQQKEIKAA